MIQNLATYFNASSVRIGNIWVPGKHVEQTLARFGKLLFCLNHSPKHPYTLRGTATALRWRNECMLFCCRHQFQGYQPENVVIPLDKSAEILISGSTFVWRHETAANRDEDYLDVCAMKFVPENYNAANLEQGFLSVSEADCWNGSKDAHFLLFGYPTNLRNVDYDEPHIQVQQVVTSAVFRNGTSSEGVFRLEMTRTKNFSSDGLSGGPVFHLGEDSRGFFVGFAGIIMRGSDTSEFLHMLGAQHILQFFKMSAS